MTILTPQADRVIRQAANNLMHLATLAGVVVTIETQPRQPLAMGNNSMRLGIRPIRHPDPAAADKCRRPDVLERVEYHEGSRNDMSLEECLSYLANGWKETPGRTPTEMVLQILELLAASPSTPHCYSDCQAYTKGIEIELTELQKKVATYEARDALGLVPQPTGANGPDGKEWAKTAAGYTHVQAMVPLADGQSRAPFWYGWALRGAFVAGAEWQESRFASGLPAAYAPLSRAELADLTCMLAGAPWPESVLDELGELLEIYDNLRAAGNRPVDPAKTYDQLLVNPWTGEARNARDVESDPKGLLIIPPGGSVLAAEGDDR